MDTSSLLIKVHDFCSENWCVFRFAAGFFSNQIGSTLLAKLGAKAGEVPQVDGKEMADVFDFGDPGLDQLKDAKAIQGLIGIMASRRKEADRRRRHDCH